MLFDGTCAFCEGAVKFIATRDPQGYFRFGASQTDKATALLALCGMTRQAARSPDSDRARPDLPAIDGLAVNGAAAALALVPAGRSPHHPSPASRSCVPPRRRDSPSARGAVECVRDSAAGDSRAADLIGRRSKCRPLSYGTFDGDRPI